MPAGLSSSQQYLDALQGIMKHNRDFTNTILQNPPVEKFQPPVGIDTSGINPQYQGNGGVATGGGGLDPNEQWIIGRESSGRVTADNPNSTAFGLGQLLIANRRSYGRRLGISNPDTTNYNEQLAMMRLYIKERYGNSAKAKQFWQAHGWY